MGGGPLGHFDLDESFGALPVSEQIIAALSRNAAKVLDLFRSWDNNNDGIVTRAEFHKAMRELGLEVPKTAIDAIFSKWDDDDSGILSARGSCCTSTRPNKCHLVLRATHCANSGPCVSLFAQPSKSSLESSARQRIPRGASPNSVSFSKKTASSWARHSLNGT